VRIQPDQHTRGGYRDQGGVGDHSQVRTDDDAALANRPVVHPDVGEDGRTAALGPVAGRVLDLVSGEEAGAAQDAARGLHPLTASTVESDADHGSTLADQRYPGAQEKSE
jgi:hypothetical protein